MILTGFFRVGNILMQTLPPPFWSIQGQISKEARSRMSEDLKRKGHTHEMKGVTLQMRRESQSTQSRKLTFFTSQIAYAYTSMLFLCNYFLTRPHY